MARNWRQRRRPVQYGHDTSPSSHQFLIAARLLLARYKIILSKYPYREGKKQRKGKSGFFWHHFIVFLCLKYTKGSIIQLYSSNTKTPDMIFM